MNKNLLCLPSDGVCGRHSSISSAPGLLALGGAPIASLMLAVLLVALVCVPAQGATYTVGNAVSCDYDNIFLALLAAFVSAEDDTIRIVDDQANMNLILDNWDPDGSQGALTLDGGFDSCLSRGAVTPARTLLAGNSSGPVITVRALGGNRSVVTLTNLSLIGATGHRGLVVDGAEVTLRNLFAQFNAGGFSAINGAQVSADEFSQFVQNDARPALGGGLYCSASTVDFAGELVANQGQDGGGAFLENGCHLNLESGSDVVTNRAVDGAGIALTGSGTQLLATQTDVSIRGPRIGFNLSTGNGGGIFATDSARAIIYNSWVDGNVAALQGGGIYAAQATVTVGRLQEIPCWAPVGPTGFCSYLGGNRITSDAESEEGTAIYAEDTAQVDVYQTSVDRNTSVNKQGDLFVARHVGTLIDLEGVSYSNNGADVLLAAFDGTIQARFVSSANNTRLFAGQPLSSLEGVAIGDGTVSIFSSVLGGDGGFAEALGGQIAGDCVYTASLGGGSFTRSTSSMVFPFTDPDLGNLRPLPLSNVVDYCDNSLSGTRYEDLDGRSRGTDDPGINDLHGRYDLGAYEAEGVLFADGFESGSTSGWQ